MSSARKSAKKSGQLDAVKLSPSVSKAVGNVKLLLSEVDLAVTRVDPVSATNLELANESTSWDLCCMGEQRLCVIKNKINTICSDAPMSLLLIRDSRMIMSENYRGYKKI